MTPESKPPSSNWKILLRLTPFIRPYLPFFALALLEAVKGAGVRLLWVLPSFFRGHSPLPSLLHGDLWSGNAGRTADGEPVIYDPAVYYGDHEADLAMTELFGGFPRSFQEAYRAEFPLDAGYETRKHLYNLYHVLNHLNLFGGGYGAKAQRMIERLLAQT